MTLTTEHDLPPLVGNVDLLEKAFDHLVDNAIHYTSARGAVTLYAYVAEAELIIEIHDTGVGIAQAELANIFMRFHRADDAHSTRGFGLGLPIVQKIIAGHGGHVAVESEPGAGTTFRVYLPLRRFLFGNRFNGVIPLWVR